MTVKVVDSSAFAALIFQEAKAAEIARRLDGHDLHAPTLLRFEMANVCLKKIEELPHQRDILIEQHRQSLGVHFHLHDIEPSEVVALAERLELTAYDASFLWLARALGVELVTLDTDLTKAIARP